MPESEKTQKEQVGLEKELGAETRSVETLAAKLNKFGGFAIVEATVEGAQNLNPEKKARKKIFLTESAKDGERNELKKRVNLLLELLSESETLPDMIETCEKKVNVAQNLLKENLSKALESTKALERSYRSVVLFFKNTEESKIRNISILNADPEQIKDLDNDTFFQTVSLEIEKNYDRLDLTDNYSLLVMPGYLGSKSVVEKWAKMAYKNKVMMVTDFEHLDAPEDVLDLFNSAKLTGGDAYLSNVIMTCNWLVGRGKNKDLEEEDLFVPPSTALAGKMYKTLMSQVTAGKKHGGINEVEGVRFPMMKKEIAELEKAGLVPMVFEYGKVMAFSAKTLFNNEDNLGLQTYSVVRVFDYVTKVLIDFLNRRAFENFNGNTRMDIQKQIVRFLDKNTGPNKLIEKFKIIRFDRDPKQKDRIYLDIHMTPYFPAKNFLIRLDGTKGDDPDSAEWKAEYEQSK